MQKEETKMIQLTFDRDSLKQIDAKEVSQESLDLENLASALLDGFVEFLKEKKQCQAS